MNFTFFGNLALGIFMSISIALLWGMINTLQILIHMNMFAVVVPPNVTLFFTYLVSLVNMKLQFVDVIMSKVVSITDSVKSELSSSFSQSGYESSSMLANLSTVIFGAIVLVALITVAFLLRFLKKKFGL